MPTSEYSQSFPRTLSHGFAHRQQEQMGEYVAHLQIHMALQARNLVPALTKGAIDHRSQLLHQTQAEFEKAVSRQ
jgi:myo-inositol catabolism protein IolC